MASVRTKGSGRGRAASCQQGVREARVNLYYVVAIWMAMALAASLISIRIAIPVALVEIVVGAVAGNIPGWLLAVFAVVTVVALAALPRLIRVLIRWAGHRVSEPEIKFLLVVLLALGGLATQAGSKAVLPAYVAGLVVAGVFARDRGSIAALFGLTHGLINERQYTE